MTGVHEALRRRRVARLRAQDGWVVITAVILMTVMIGVGLAALATVDTQSSESRKQRVRESSFNLAEGLIHAQSLMLQNNWPTQAQCANNAKGCGYAWSAAAPDTCTQATAAGNSNQCPNPTTLVGDAGAFSNVDQQLADTAWSIQVRDDLGVDVPGRTDEPYASDGYYFTSGQIPTYARGTAVGSTSTGTLPGVDRQVCRNAANQPVVCTWDANGNKRMWVRVDTTVSGRKRSIVALLALEAFNVPFEINAVAGGAVNFTNQGNKIVVDATGSQVLVRCRPTNGTNPTTGTPISTTLTATMNAGTNVATVATNAGFVQGMVVALDAGTGTAPPYELLVVQSVPGTNQIRFTTNATSTHSSGRRVELAPNNLGQNNAGRNNCQTWGSPNAPGENGAPKQQLNPYFAYISNPNAPPALSTAILNRIKLGLPTYRDTCPTNWTGNLVIERAPAGGCPLPGGVINSEAAPAFIIVEDILPGGACTPSTNPVISLSNTTTFWGVIYVVNKQGCDESDGPVIFLQANAQIGGGLAVDGRGRVEIGQAQGGNANCVIKGVNNTCPNIVFKRHAFSVFAAAGAAGLVQNTWRELSPNQ